MWNCDSYLLNFRTKKKQSINNQGEIMNALALAMKIIIIILLQFEASVIAQSTPAIKPGSSFYMCCSYLKLIWPMGPSPWSTSKLNCDLYSTRCRQHKRRSPWSTRNLRCINCWAGWRGTLRTESNNCTSKGYPPTLLWS